MRVDSAPGALNNEQYGQSTGDDISKRTADTELPWGTMRADCLGALNLEQYRQSTCHIS